MNIAHENSEGIYNSVPRNQVIMQVMGISKMLLECVVVINPLREIT